MDYFSFLSFLGFLLGIVGGFVFVLLFYPRLFFSKSIIFEPFVCPCCSTFPHISKAIYTSSGYFFSFSCSCDSVGDFRSVDKAVLCWNERVRKQKAQQAAQQTKKGLSE
ncbi:MAG: hypothetical protein SD837_21900 [Candidatus Electrothrix scaldis]|nr:MAG: hypothetical protein SD837_21900 [Candidatus Electrothrix sp. GW3-3]